MLSDIFEFSTPKLCKNKWIQNYTLKKLAKLNVPDFIPGKKHAFVSPPDEVGTGGIGVASDVRLAVRPASGFLHLFPEQISCMDFFNFDTNIP